MTTTVLDNMVEPLPGATISAGAEDDRETFAAAPARTHFLRKPLPAERELFGPDGAHVLVVRMDPWRFRIPIPMATGPEAAERVAADLRARMRASALRRETGT